jgi:hypothetical protein
MRTIGVGVVAFVCLAPVAAASADELPTVAAEADAGRGPWVAGWAVAHPEVKDLYLGVGPSVGWGSRTFGFFAAADGGQSYFGFAYGLSAGVDVEFHDDWFIGRLAVDGGIHSDGKHALTPFVRPMLVLGLALDRREEWSLQAAGGYYAAAEVMGNAAHAGPAFGLALVRRL